MLLLNLKNQTSPNFMSHAFVVMVVIVTVIAFFWILASKFNTFHSALNEESFSVTSFSKQTRKADFLWFHLLFKLFPSLSSSQILIKWQASVKNHFII